MKTKIYSDKDLNADAIKDLLESENCGVEEKEFIKAFSDEELQTVESEYLDDSKKLAVLNSTSILRNCSKYGNLNPKD